MQIRAEEISNIIKGYDKKDAASVVASANGGKPPWVK